MSRYQHFHDLAAGQYERLKADVKVRGILLPILVDEDGKTIDGHQRRQVAAELGIDCPSVVVSGLTEEEKHSAAIVLNLFRRHLTGVERAKALHELGLLGLSIRSMADLLGVSKSTVHRDLQGVERPETITDTLGREQPTTRDVSRAGHVDAPPPNVDPETGEIAPTEPAGDSSPTGSDDGAEDETGQGKEATSEPVSSAPVDPVLKYNADLGAAVKRAREGVLAFDPADLIRCLDYEHRALLYEFVDTARAWCDAVNERAQAGPRLEVVG